MQVNGGGTGDIVFFSFFSFFSSSFSFSFAGGSGRWVCILKLSAALLCFALRCSALSRELPIDVMVWLVWCRVVGWVGLGWSWDWIDIE